MIFVSKWDSYSLSLSGERESCWTTCWYLPPLRILGHPDLQPAWWRCHPKAQSAPTGSGSWFRQDLQVAPRIRNNQVKVYDTWSHMKAWTMAMMNIKIWCKGSQCSFRGLQCVHRHDTDTIRCHYCTRQWDIRTRLNQAWHMPGYGRNSSWSCNELTSINFPPPSAMASPRSIRKFQL